MSKQFEVIVCQVITRRIVIRTTSAKRAQALIKAGPLSYIKAEVSNEIIEMQEDVVSVKECETEA